MDLPPDLPIALAKNVFEDAAHELLCDRDVLRRKIEFVTGRTGGGVDLLLGEVIKFIYLCAVGKCGLTPSQIVDDAWHEFILFTELYDDFCQEWFQRKIHHLPSDDTKENHERYELTLACYTCCFGTPPTSFWPSPGVEVGDCGSCKAD